MYVVNKSGPNILPCMWYTRRNWKEVGLYCKMRTGLGKIAHNVFKYYLRLFWNHLTHLVRITGIACAFEPRFARYGVHQIRWKSTVALKPAIFDSAVS